MALFSGLADLVCRFNRTKDSYATVEYCYPVIDIRLTPSDNNGVRFGKVGRCDGFDGVADAVADCKSHEGRITGDHQRLSADERYSVLLKVASFLGDNAT